MSVAGPNCQTNINECASNPCLNQGTCIDDVAGYKCNCLLPYTGTKDTHILPLTFYFIHTQTQMHRHPSVCFTRHCLVFCRVWVCMNILLRLLSEWELLVHFLHFYFLFPVKEETQNCRKLLTTILCAWKVSRK